MTNEQLLAALQALPAPDLMTATKLDDPLGAGAYYRADTVARMLAPLQKAARDALAVLKDIDEPELVRLRGRADLAIRDLRAALR